MTQSPEEDPFLTTRQLAERWKISTNTLVLMRSRDQGPAFLKFGKLVRYYLEDIEIYEREIRQGTEEQE